MLPRVLRELLKGTAICATPSCVARRVHGQSQNEGHRGSRGSDAQNALTYSDVPLGKYDDLARYDGSVIAERTKGELSARCDKEEMNYLALNLAHDVATGRRTVEDARRFYAETAMATMKGEMPPYVQRLQFDPSRGGTADPDKSMMPK